MPHHKSAKKRVKTNEIRRKRNAARRTRMRRSVRDLRTTLATASVLDEAQTRELVAVESLLDRMAGKGLIHRNKAARLKSRLTRQANARSEGSEG
ncbi:MAG TPA: 30S ribosomal protein S20 [Candidatus Krumholzibacteria bacterium]|nr:30S ribosomal protein S20 [Candidatus Krumholzibacteria bacterium]